jgi:CheY-like chemotaxis protein
MNEHTVLHVDDDASLLELSGRTLREDAPELTVATATSADEGLRTLERERVDCVVSDSVRTASGESFVDVVRRRRPDLPVVVFSGASFGAGATDAAAVVRKGTPGDLERLSTTVSALVADGDLPGSEWTLLTRYDPAEGRGLVPALALALADHLDREPTDLPPLYDTVDPDALAAVVSPRDRDGSPDAAVRVEFDYLDRRVRVTRSGHVAVR